MEPTDSVRETFDDYKCFIEPFGSSANENDEGAENLGNEDNAFTQMTQRTKDHSSFQKHIHGEAMETASNSQEKTRPLARTDCDLTTKAYRQNTLQLQKIIEQKVQEVEDVTAEKEELESTVQSVLHKLWAKEEELHNERKNSYKREQGLIDVMKQEKVRCKKLELHVQSLRDENLSLQDQVRQMEYQLLTVKQETENWRMESEQQLPELENAQEFFKNFTEDIVGRLCEVLTGQNKEQSGDVSLSPRTVEGSYSGSNDYERTGEGVERLGDEERLRGRVSEDEGELRNKLKRLWHTVVRGRDVTGSAGPPEVAEVTQPEVWQPELDADDKLFQEIHQAYLKANTKAVDLEKQSAYYLEKLQEVQKAACLVEGKIQRLWVKFELYGDEEEASRGRRDSKAFPDVESMAHKIEDAITRHKSTLEENERLKRLNICQRETIAKATKQIDILREENTQTLKELDRKNVKIHEIMLETSKAINNKNVEIEVLTEQLQEFQNKADQQRLANLSANSRKDCTSADDALAKKQREFAVVQKDFDKEKMALEEELEELRDAFERVSKNNGDLQGLCEILKDKVESEETQINSVEEAERNVKQLFEQQKRKNEKLKTVMAELYAEVQIRRQENQAQEASISILQEKVKCLEVDVDNKTQELQLDRKNLKNTKETETYLQSSLDKALGELFQLKDQNEESPRDGQEVEALTTQPVDSEDEHRSLVERVQELESLHNTTLAKSVQDVQDSAVRIERLCEENTFLRKEVSECKICSFKLNKTNERLKALLKAMKEDLLEEMRSKKDAVKRKQELEVFLQKSKEKAIELEDRLQTSQLPDVKETDETEAVPTDADEPAASVTDISVQEHGKAGTSKGKGKRKLIPKVLTRHFSSSSVKSKINLPEDGGGVSRTRSSTEDLIAEINYLQRSMDVMKKDLQYDKHVRAKMVEQQHRLRNVLMAVEHDKEDLEQEVERLTVELRRKEKGLQTCETLRMELSVQVGRNAHETVEVKKGLNILLGKTQRAQTKINRDTQSLTESLKDRDKQIRKLERSNEKCTTENTNLVKRVDTLTERLGNEVKLKEGALEERRQLKDSLQTVLGTKEILQLTQLEFSCIAIDEQASPRIMPQMEKDEVREILQEVLGEIEFFKSEEVSRLNQRLSELSEELNVFREENEHFRSLALDGDRDEQQRAEETISRLSEQLKISREKQGELRETCFKDRVMANEELGKVYQRYAELKVTMKSKEEALEQFKELEKALVSDYCELHKELDSVKFNALLPRTEKIETKTALEGLKRKYDHLQESFSKECHTLIEENNWLHKQLAEESSICEEVQRGEARLDDSLRDTEQKLQQMNRELKEHQEARACLEEKRVVLETRITCLVTEKDDLKNELCNERSAALETLTALRNENQASAKQLKRQQQEEKNLVTKVLLLENEKKKLEDELKERERLMATSQETFTEERGGLTEKVRRLRICLEKEIRRRLELEVKMQQILNISVMEQSQTQAAGGSSYSGQSARQGEIKTSIGAPRRDLNKPDVMQSTAKGVTDVPLSSKNNDFSGQLDQGMTSVLNSYEQQLEQLQSSDISD